MTSQLQLALLGEPKVTLNGVPLTGFISAKAQALLFYWAITGRSHSRATLAALFWDEMPEAAAKKNLTKAISNLRKLVGDYVLANNQSAGLNFALLPEIDVQLFIQGVEEIANGNQQPGMVNQQFHKAIDLYQGELLQGFYVKDAPVFEEWLWGERERLHQMALRGILITAEEHATHNDLQRSIDDLNRLLHFDPLHEEAHLQLIQALARSGQRGAALAHYDSCCKLLAEELGVEPSVEMQELCERIRRAGDRPPNNLPALVGFVGREIELEELRQLLAEPHCRLVTIAGPGGIGKTRLALQLATAIVESSQTLILENSFSDGVYFLSLVTHTTLESIPALLADTLGFTLQGQEQPRQQIIDYLRNKEMLLILDNVEQLFTGPEPSNQTKPLSDHISGTTSTALLNTLITSAPRLKVVLTSRVRVGIEQEHIFHLSGMEVPITETLTLDQHGTIASVRPNRTTRSRESFSELLNYSSIQFFAQCAKRLRPDFRLTPETIEPVVQICQRVQGMPLGILLAASWITVLTPKEIQNELAQNFDLLESQAHNIPSRQRSVRAAFDYTWNLLSAREQEIFTKLSLFQGTFTRQAAQQVADATLRDLMTMVNKSLLFPAQEGRFHIHELLRQFGAEKLEEKVAQARAARDQHCFYFAEIAEQCAIDFRGPEQQSALAMMEIDGENIRAGWHWAVKENHLAQLAQYVDGICQFYVWRGRFQEGAALIHDVTSHLGLLAGSADALVSASQLDKPQFPSTNFTSAQFTSTNFTDENVSLRIELLIWLGIFTLHVGRKDDALAFLGKSLQWLDQVLSSATDGKTQIALTEQHAFALLHLGETMRESDREEARRHYEESLRLYRVTDHSWGMANTFEALGWLIQHWGSYREAGQLYQESLVIRQALGDQRGLANALRAQGGIALYQGDPQHAEQLIRESLLLMQANGDRIGIAACLGKLGEVLIALGQFTEAQNILQEANAHYRDLGLRDASAFIEAIGCLALLHQGAYERAQQQAEAALTIFQQLQAQRGTAYAHLVLGWVALGRGTITDAEQHLLKSLSTYRVLKQQDELGQAHALIALVDYSHDQIAGAETHLQQAQQIAESIQAAMPRILAIAIHSHIKHAQGKETEAMWHYHAIAQLPLVASSQWFAQFIPNNTDR